MNNLKRHARLGLVISWAPPWIEGEGHVNTMKFSESRKKLEGEYGFEYDRGLTKVLREATTISWIKETVAFYHAN